MSKFKPRHVALAGAAAFLGTTMLTPPAAAQSVEELQAQIEVLQSKITQIEAKQDSAMVAPAQAVEAGDKPRSIKWPGTNTSFQVGGYAKGDFIYDVKSRNGETFAASAIPRSDSEADEREGHVLLHARQSRVWFKSWTPTEMGEMTTHIEADFFSGGGNELVSNSRIFRLRHAYGTLGGLLVGQTWTNFMTFHAYPDTVDFFGPTGMPFLRQAQIRYTFRPSDALQASVSVENPENDAFGVSSVLAPGTNLGPAAETLGGPGFDQIPDFVGRVQYSAGNLTVSGSGVIKWVNFTDTDLGGLGGACDESEVTWGLHGAATLGVFGTDSISVAAHGGDGIGRYMLANNIDAASIDVDTCNVETYTKWGVQANYGHRWTDTLASWVAYGMVDFDEDTGLKRFQTVHVNLIWTPVGGTKFGIEGIWGRNERADSTLVGSTSDENDQFRIQFGAQFVF